MSATAITSLPSLTEAFQLDVKTVESGVSLEAFQAFAEQSGLPLRELHEVVIPARTLKHRRARKEPLSRDESDKFARLVRVFDQAVRVFDEAERARLWLEEPKSRFEGRTPLEMLRTEVGGRLVEEMLVQLEYGMFA